MRTAFGLSALLAALVVVPLGAHAEPPNTASRTPVPLVFFDIAGPASAKLDAFYAGVFGWSIDAGGRIGPKSTGGLDGALRQDPPGKILYLGVPDVTAALNDVVKAGGKIVQPRFVVPGVVVLGLFTDPAGNPMGLVEMKDGKPVVPPSP